MSQKNIGPKIKLTGYSTFVKQVKMCQAQLNLLAATMKLNATQFTTASNKSGLFVKNIGNLKAKQHELQAQLRLNSELLRQSNAEYGTASKQSIEYQTVIMGLKEELLQTVIALKQQNVELAKSTIEWSKFGIAAQFCEKIQPLVAKISTGLMTMSKYASLAAIGLGAVFGNKALKRLKTIDTAEAKLTALGYNVEKVSKQVQNSVMGTANRLEDAFNIAPSALAAGAESSYGLENYLKRIGDLAAFTGNSMTQMGTLMNKALSKGHVDARLLNQMLYNGIPIYTLLQEHLEVTGAELTSMVRKGQVSFDDLYQATAEFDGMAQQLAGKTLPGLAEIIEQRFTQIAQTFIEKPYELLKGDLQTFAQWIKDNSEKFKEWGRAFGDALEYAHNKFVGNESDMNSLSEKAQKMAKFTVPLYDAIKGVVEWFKKLNPETVKFAAKVVFLGGPISKLASKLLLIPIGIKNLMTGFIGVLPKMASFTEGAGLAGTSLGKLVTGLNGKLVANGGAFAKGMLKVTGIIGACITGFILMLKNSEKFRESIGRVAKAIGSTVVKIFDKFKDILGTLGSVVGDVAGMLGDFLAPLLGMVADLLGYISPVLVGIVDIISMAIKPLEIVFDILKGIIGVLTGSTWEEAFADAEKHANDFLDSLPDDTAVVNPYGVVMEENAAFAEECQYTAKTWADSFEVGGSSVKQSLDSVSDTVEQTAITFENLDSDVQEVVKSMQDAYQDLAEASQNMFDTINTNSELGLETMIENLQTNAEAISEWGDNIQYLIDNGVSEGLINSLLQAGTDSAGEVANLVEGLKADPSKIEELNASWDEAGAAAQEAFQKAYGADALSDEIMNMVTLSEQTLSESISAIDWASITGNIDKGMANGIADGSEEVNQAMKDVSDGMSDTLETENDMHSPSRKYHQYGIYIMQGFENGLKTKLSSVSTFFKNLSRRLQNSLNKNALYNSLYQVGAYAMDGFRNGIVSKGNSAILAANTIATNVADTMREALHIQSPSKVCYQIGAYAGEGLVNGLVAYSLASREAGEMLATSVMTGMSGIDLRSGLQRAIDNTNRSMINASNTFEIPLDYGRLASAMMNYGIYIDSRLVGRTKLGKGMVIA